MDNDVEEEILDSVEASQKIAHEIEMREEKVAGLRHFPGRCFISSVIDVPEPSPFDLGSPCV